MSQYPEYPPASQPPAPSQPPLVAVRNPRRMPLVTYTLIGLCVIIYLIQLGTDAALGVDLPLVLGAKINEFIRAGQLWRFFTPMLLHGSILHILFNMYALYNFGPTLEHHYGRLRFLTLFVLGGFAGNVISFMFSQNPSVGSSTAIFGLLGAEGIFLYQNRELFGEVANRALSQVVTIAAINLFIGLSPGIDNWGHIGGLLGGSLFAWFAGPLPRVVGLYPNLQLEDSRSQQAVWVAALGVAGAFAFMAAFALFFS